MGETSFVSVGVQIGNVTTLFKFSQEEPLESIVETLCNDNNLTFSKGKFSLQFIRLQNDSNLSAKFVTEENRDNIINGTELKLVYSPQELSQMILGNLKNCNGDINWALEKLSGHINDPVFASVIYEPCYPLINNLLDDENLPPKLLNCCLRVVLGLLRFDHLKEIDLKLIKKLVKIINSEQHLENIVLENTLLIIEECITKTQYNQLEELIELEDLLPHLWDRDSPNIQQCALSLINTFTMRCTDPSKKIEKMKTMDTARFRETISKNILYQGVEPTVEMKQQLATYQSVILSLYHSLYRFNHVKINDLPDTEFIASNKRYSHYETCNSLSSEGINDLNNVYRRRSAESYTAQSSDKLNYSWKKTSMDFMKNLTVEDDSHSREMCEINNKPVNQLVYNCLMHFYQNHHKNYRCALVTEGVNTFLKICCEVVNLIAKDVLRIGDPPTPKSTTYFTLLFSSNSSNMQPFIEELFCQAMLLLERTKREMKAKTYEDYEKVMKVMKRQIFEGLSAQPRSFPELQMLLRGITYSAVCEQLWTEKTAKENRFYATSPAVLEIKTSLRDDLIKIIIKQRLNYISKGSNFPVWDSQRSQKVKHRFWYACLSPSKEKILYTDNPDLDDTFKMDCMYVKHIKNIVTGRKCPHIREIKQRSQNQDVNLAFTIVPNTDDIQPLNFLANSQQEFDYWTDAINALKGNKMKSNSFREELTTLQEIDLRVKLLELDGIEIPIEIVSPPPIPPPPPDYDFYYKEPEESNAEIHSI